MPITYSCKHVNREKGIDYGAAAAAVYMRVSVNLRSVATIQVNGPGKYLNEQKRKKPLLRKSIVGDGDASWKTRSPLGGARDEKFRLNIRRPRGTARTRRACARSCCSL